MQRMLSFVGENELLTLRENKDEILAETHIILSTTTVHRKLDGQLFTVEKVLAEPSKMNSDQNKEKRATLQHVQDAFVADRTIIFMDETHLNLFTRRNFGRSRKGTG